ncbi:MAG: hypothetical protein J6B81_03315 [Spirochaetaceae bacterium]|nr:hypothetical protein [Spirochaetaceae bacterium]
MASRKKQTLKNITVAFFSNILIYVLSLFTSRVIKERLGLDILGLNGVLANVISILSLTELGVGGAITFALYKPLAHQNRELIKSIMAFYKKAYRIIALAVAVLGLVLLPLVPNFIKSSEFSNKYIYVVYLLFLANSVLSYLLVYKRTLIVADQKNYVITTITLIYTYVLKISQLVAVYFTSNYILFLVIQIVSTLVYNLVISFVCDKLYPFLKEGAEKLPQEHIQIITKKVKALFFHSLGTVIVLGTDNILISYFCGITEGGRYTSYLSIINMIGTIVVIIFDNLRDSLGNFLVTETRERKRELFNNLFFMNQTLVAIFSICLWLLLTHFVQFWFGADTVLQNYVVASMVLCFYIQKSMLAAGGMKSSAGLFEQDRFVSIYESCINLVASILLARKFGIMGVILGTIISTLAGPFLAQPIILFKNIFKENSIKYFTLYSSYFSRFLLILGVSYFLFHHVIGFIPTNIFSFLLEAVLLFMFVCICWFISVAWKKETRYFIGLVKGKVKREK